MDFFPINTNLAEMYTDEVINIQHGNEYDIRINAVQTALMILGYYDNESIEINATIFGIMDSSTTQAIKKFQSDNSIPKTGYLDRETYSKIFEVLKTENSIIIIKSGHNSISIESLSTLMNNITNDLEYFLNEDSDNEEGNAIIGNLLNNNLLEDFPIYRDIYDKLDIIEDYVVNSGGVTILDDFIELITNGGFSGSFEGDFFLTGNETFDELLFNYISSGGETFGDFIYDFNSDSGRTNVSGSYISSQDGKKNYNHIYSLLANSMYDIKFEENMRSSNTNAIKKYHGKYKTSSNLPFFGNNNGSILGKQKYDLTIVYGAEGSSATKIIGLTPLSVAQELNASGDPIREVIEFVAKDVVYSE